ncbi:MAG: hypothetical protein ACREBR_02240 [bacterium]
MESAESRYSMAKGLLKGRARELWTSFETAEGEKTLATFSSVLKKMKKHYLPPRAYRRQKHYMRKHLKKRKSVSVKDFVARLRELNKYLQYFPKDSDEQP